MPDEKGRLTRDDIDDFVRDLLEAPLVSRIITRPDGAEFLEREFSWGTEAILLRGARRDDEVSG